ncbi:potassium-transporting ATPase subunit KdpA [Chryseobacterium indologenes]|uniref:potassium-transporting ATPase subunit KdpA n=1 Tax=Chryseobacterium indologenes TaxID=253 RepID=UPI000F4DA819|nr:potassium-transporting ATPase subunit KdpA [Chryseobacterium indologenes]AYZ36888.1 potassium-transporting ATPase subunit KdpA [Chryseobacterium indologenes]MBF6645714.1 potassium-transporting ATPase subunit KdpA [Chryseobacterium indologenes]MBU3049714.1 potassium-transporting ATPase subunit KdpA [Chryseobacterium indologenes]MEB4763308.1 potassium-transporting ATPase subunit KdpA [Chryseobacterium indologenes]QQQ70615.1 potassium-transporting ATPase subunit KdpA [Chryseobacterium indologe
MNTEILGIIAMFAITLVIGILLGKYIANVYGYKKTVLDPIFQPIEKLIYKISGINPNRQMNWKQNMYAMLAINFVWFIIGFILLMTQAWLPLNPDGNPNMSPDLAFNTTISFLVNCNLQHYSGESGVSYLSQLYLMFLQFVTAGTGMAAMAVLFKAFKEKTATELGNFYDYFIKSMIRILVPISIIVAFILSVNGTPMTFEGKDQITGLEGQKIEVSRGPVAGFVAIKHLGTNGGGFFGTNSAHPLENPNYVTNMTEMVTQMIIPFALVFALGFYLNRRKLSWVIFTVMTVGFLALTVPNIVNETGGNPLITKMGADSSLGAMEGKEIRFGSAASGYWSIATTVISTGSVNSMHDSTMPLSGMNELLAMMINCFYGGCGVGILNYFIFIILAVFISGLMVGRTPEFMGKKIEAKEMKIAMIVALFHPFLILVGTALTAYLPEFGTKTLNNPGFHGFSEMLYEFTSSSANNGSGFEGLGDNTPWWNISTGIVLLLSRFIPIIGPVAIAGLLAQKKFIPESSGTLKTDTATFGFMTLAVILLIAALSFFPALTLGPIAEQIQYFSK